MAQIDHVGHMAHTLPKLRVQGLEALCVLLGTQKHCHPPAVAAVLGKYGVGGMERLRREEVQCLVRCSEQQDPMRIHTYNQKQV